MTSSRSSRREFVHHFEGGETLDILLAHCGSTLTTPEVVQAMLEAQAEGISHSDFVPSLFEAEPYFDSPAVAQSFFQNLLGLWDLVAAGEPFQSEEGPRPPRPKKEKPIPPPAFAPGEPDEAFVEAAWRYLEEDEKARTRALHVFENRQDSLLGALDEASLKDEGYAVARHLLFELHAILELGWPRGLASADLSTSRVKATGALPVPSALSAYATEVLFEAEHDEGVPLNGEQLDRVRSIVERGLTALWSARKGA